jgi:hypothetical protein
VLWPDDPARLLRRDRKGDRRMAEQSGERRVTAEVGAELIRLMVPDLDPELVQLILNRAARSAASGLTDYEGHRGTGGKPQDAQLQEYAELLALIRDAGIDRAQLCAILGLDPETLSAGDDNPHPPIQ